MKLLPSVLLLAATTAAANPRRFDRRRHHHGAPLGSISPAPADAFLPLEQDDPDAAGAGTSLFAINNRGAIVGNYANGAAVDGFIYQNGTWTDVSPPFATGGFSELLGINDAGTAIGDAADASGQEHVFTRSAAGVFTELPAPVPGVVGHELQSIDNAGEIVGAYSTVGSYFLDGTPCVGYVYSHGAYHPIDIPNAVCVIPYGLDDRGQITGTWVDASGFNHGFLLDRATHQLRDLTVAGMDTNPWRINNAGEVVGDFVGADDELHGFVLRGSSLEQVDYPGATDTVLLGLNDAGVIVGTFDGFTFGVIDVPLR
ncbi:MAG TPA: hypothetical protein VGM88_31990 [Kofleriaceae bacterium]|jgi:hypothetical protein